MEGRAEGSKVSTLSGRPPASRRLLVGETAQPLLEAFVPLPWVYPAPPTVYQPGAPRGKVECRDGLMASRRYHPGSPSMAKSHQSLNGRSLHSCP